MRYRWFLRSISIIVSITLHLTFILGCGAVCEKSFLLPRWKCGKIVIDSFVGGREIPYLQTVANWFFTQWNAKLLSAYRGYLKFFALYNRFAPYTCFDWIKNALFHGFQSLRVDVSSFDSGEGWCLFWFHFVSFFGQFFLSSWVVKHFFFFSFFGRASLPFRTLTLDYPDVLWPMVGEVALNPPD